MADPTAAEEQLKWDDVGAQFGAGFVAAMQSKGIEKDILNVLLRRDGAVQALMFDLLGVVAQKVGEGLHAVEEPFLPLIAELVTPILSGLFGAEFNAGEFQAKLNQGAGNRGAQAILEGFMRAIVGDTPAEIQPSDVGAKRIAAAAVQASLESTFNAIVPELLSDIFPEGIGHFTALTELPENIIRALGVSRLVRRALQPIVTTCCTTPATWYMNKQHRPTLLGASTLAKQIARNPAQAETWREDLRREGYTEARIEALLNEQAKFHSIADLDLLVRASQWSVAEAMQHLANQGYTSAIASTELDIEKLKRIATFERAMASAAVDAYVAGRISEGTLGGFITGSTISAQEKAQYDELAAARRICSIQPLTPAEAKACVLKNILTVRDYRDALIRDGRTEDAVAALELLLRAELDDKADLAQLRAQQAADRAAEKLARDKAKAVKLAEVAAARALARRGSEADLEAAAVRGLIPLARVQEVYAARYDTDTVGILLDELTDRRAAFVAQQAAADDARKRAAVRHIDVGALEQAVLAHVLTLDQFRGALDDRAFAPEDVAVLTDTLAARLAALDAAARARDEAAAAAKVKHLDLGRMETLVRRGHRTLHDYDAFLAGLGFDDAARAAMAELLQLTINDDAAAAALRAQQAAASAVRELSLDQVRRGVILGLTSIDTFTPWLLAHGYTTPDAALLLAELSRDVDEAVAARARRDEADRRIQAGRAPLPDVRRAARLGLIPVDVYYGRLRAAGYTDDDVAIESDLLATEIAKDGALRAAAAAADAAPTSPGLTLAQLAAAVRAGATSIADYTGRALALGFTNEDAKTLTATLQDELDVTAVARARRAALAAEGADRELARADVEKAVKAGLKTIDDYQAYLVGAGYADDDAALLVALLEDTLDGGAGGSGAA